MLHFDYILSENQLLSKKNPKANWKLPLAFYKVADGQEIASRIEITITYNK